MPDILRAGKGMTPRGVFRFKSFEEADEWLLEMKTLPEKSWAAGVDLLGEDLPKILQAFKKAMLGLPNGAIREMEATDLSQHTVVRLSEREWQTRNSRSARIYS